MSLRTWAQRTQVSQTLPREIIFNRAFATLKGITLAPQFQYQALWFFVEYNVSVAHFLHHTPRLFSPTPSSPTVPCLEKENDMLWSCTSSTPTTESVLLELLLCSPTLSGLAVARLVTESCAPDLRFLHCSATCTARYNCLMPLSPGVPLVAYAMVSFFRNDGDKSRNCCVFYIILRHCWIFVDTI